MANERRLISADEIKKLFYKQIVYGATDLMAAFEDALQDCQPVDAVEVVRCKDCIHYRKYMGRSMCAKNAKMLDGHEVHLTATADDNFCSYSEKREVERW